VASRLSDEATTTAVGWPTITSSAWLGPERTEYRAWGRISATISWISLREEISIPLAALQTDRSVGETGASRVRTSRIAWVGMARIQRPEWEAASSRSPVAFRRELKGASAR